MKCWSYFLFFTRFHPLKVNLKFFYSWRYVTIFSKPLFLGVFPGGSVRDLPGPSLLPVALSLIGPKPYEDREEQREEKTNDELFKHKKPTEQVQIQRMKSLNDVVIVTDAKGKIHFPMNKMGAKTCSRNRLYCKK